MNSLENSELDIIKEAPKASLEQKKPAFKYIVWFIIITLFISYFYAMLFGERSVFVLLDDEHRLEKLKQEYNTLQNQNQKLQKKYFELIQLTPDEDSF